MRVIIAGYRHFNDYQRFQLEIGKVFKEWGINIHTPLTVISGGAEGADFLAQALAKQYNLPIEIYEADWSLGLKGGPIRNEIMATKGTHLIAFPSKDSKGTRDMIKRAIAKGLTIKVIEI